MADRRRTARSIDGKQTLVDLVDVPTLQMMMDDFYNLAGIPMALIDTDGEIIVGAGWQAACTEFHRVNEATCAWCIESDTALTADIAPGESKLYRCKNGMWDAAMPVFVGGQRLGNVFTGQFFFDDEEIDLEFFTAQAAQYEFPEAEYLAAVQAVPRLSREQVAQSLRFLTNLANMLSQLGATNADLTALVGRHEALLRRERSQSERLRTILEVESVLTTSLDFSEVVHQALKSAEAHLDVAASSVWTVDAAGNRLSLVGSRGFPDQFLTDFAEGVPLESGFPVARAARSGEPVIYECVESSRLHQPVAAAYARYGISLCSLIAVPLATSENVIGALTLAWETERKFEPEDLMLIDALASRFSVALENARVYQTEHVIAETLQETLVVLPSHLEGLEFSRAYESATYQSGRVGGDFVDVFQVDGPLVGVTLGDVSGKGLDAAVTTSLIRTTLRVHALDGHTPAVIAEKANQVMRRFSEIEAFVTLWFGLFDTSTGHLRYICAGHPPGLVLAADGAICELECLDPILGAFDTATFYESETMLGRGERLVLYSDGVTEARSPVGDFLGPEGLMEVLRNRCGLATSALSDAVMSDVVEFSKGVLRDDAAILSIEPVSLEG